MRVRNKIKPDIAEEQYGFVKQNLQPMQSNELWKYKKKKKVYLCFVNYPKAFDRIRHDEIITQLTRLKINGKDLRVIKKTSAGKRLQQCELMMKSARKKKSRKPWYQTRMCAFTRLFLSLYSEMFIRNLEGYQELK